MRSITVVCLVCLAGGIVTAQPIPAPPKAEYAAFDDGGYASDAAAQAAWEPMTGTAPVSVAALEGRKVLRMPCNFAGTKIDRASWDRKVTLDLTACQGIRFKFFCKDTSPISHFSLYFQSGDGWYSSSFAPTTGSQWNTLTIDKASTRQEGKPAGWGQISTIRLSAWRGGDVNTELYVCDFGLWGQLGADALVAVVRGESAVQKSPSETRSVEQFTQAVAQCLTGLGIGCGIISDLDVTAERLKTAKLAILPHNPGMPDNVADELAK
ncbi:MAG: hypothetical protein FJ272_19405, partial [Planctomycetes bacterium]|nr:hypothetical protein [Planctomycetota bacterium]